LGHFVHKPAGMGLFFLFSASAGFETIFGRIRVSQLMVTD
jgi:hypothetical protein